MSRLILAIFLISLIFETQQGPVLNPKSCFYKIKKLANHDKCLSSRLPQKIEAAEVSENPAQFVNLVNKIQKKCNGTFFSCGYAMSWVSEVFVGLKDQYLEYKNGFEGPLAGYKNYIGEDLKKLFFSRKNNPNHIIYQLRHNGTEDHVWTIEQLANNKGYIIYQSYNSAYSLKAWLSTKIDGMYNADNGEIMIFNKVKDEVNTLIQYVSNGQLDINSDFSNSSIPESFIPFIEYIRDYNKQTVISNFKRAWNQWGRGEIINWTSFSVYVSKLADMTAYLKKNVNTANLFSEKIFNYWIDLFGSPNPVHYIDMPNNAITNFVFAQSPRDYDFQVKVIVLNDSENCETNYNVLDKYS